MPDCAAGKGRRPHHLEGSTRLGEFEKSGIALDARVSSSLLTNIFVDRSPLHDGAVVIRGNL